MSDDARSELRLESGEYARVVAPALAAAAETAAERGDPKLFNDMASMLALMWMVSALVSRFREAVPAEQCASSEEALKAAPLGACALVFTESGLEESAVDECLSALHSAGRMLEAERIHEAGRASLDEAWQALERGQHEAGIEALRHCARELATAVDSWEAARGRPPQ